MNCKWCCSVCSKTGHWKEGTVIGVGFGVGFIPVAVGSYKTKTTISPVNKAAREFTALNDAIDKRIGAIKVEIESFSEEVRRLNEGIGKSSRRLNVLYDQLMNMDVSESNYNKLNTEYKLLSQNRERYRKRLKEITNKRGDLNEQKQQLQRIKKEINKD